jgi:hypothetical protein
MEKVKSARNTLRYYAGPPQVGAIAKLDDPDASAFFPIPVADGGLSVLGNGSLCHESMR